MFDKNLSSTSAVIILGGGLIKDDNGWRTTNFSEGDNFGALGDRLRVEAANYLYRDNPETLIIASGGKGQLREITDAPNVSVVIKKELIELGVPAENIIEEFESDSTYQQLLKIKALRATMNLNNACVISNGYHLPRIQEMINASPELKELADLKLISAEEILLNHERKRWEKTIQEAYQSEAMKTRIEAENRGIADLREGKYKLR